ncbi:DUF1540 domain-containing protein [Actinomycetaceae bacterium WB03_NA08]|uniref:DUF1540 domain-containing protein n=1 Tax=Scrofimicrobium canadense TaxID=2652290 RepID=A0A6N7VNR7_9ACTO|nr:DUF1540 domain-containing protein [Scrofimicrobium canadense]MSS83364.1 DUF1540 domain-containing protein [Scrofimicrobium canadense]
MALKNLPIISDCTVSACSYNNDGCRAGAITVEAFGNEAACGTFIPLSVKGGLPTMMASVGACQRADCTHNELLTCGAPTIKIGTGTSTADCLTFSAR